MGLRGPKPQPTALRILRGNPSHRPLNEDEPDLPPAKPSLRPPGGVTGVGRQEWKRLLPQLVERGVLTDADLTAFEDYCRTLTSLRQHEVAARRLGVEQAIMRGIANQVIRLRAQVANLRARLGLDPASRSQVKAVKTIANKTQSKLGAFLGGASRG